jgi:hypothetical protein
MLPAFRGQVTNNPVLAPWQAALPVVPPSAHPATVQRPPNISRSMFRVPAEPGILTSSGEESLPPAGTLHARQSLRFVPVMDRARLPRARPPLLRRCGRAEKVFGRQARPGAKESLARRRKGGFDTLIAAWLEIDQESGD